MDGYIGRPIECRTPCEDLGGHPNVTTLDHKIQEVVRGRQQVLLELEGPPVEGGSR